MEIFWVKHNITSITQTPGFILETYPGPIVLLNLGFIFGVVISDIWYLVA